MLQSNIHPSGGRQLSSLRALGTERLTSLCHAVGATGRVRRGATSLFDLLVESWGERAVGEEPPWPNDICDDGTPFELSLAFDGGRPLLRMLVEPQKAPFGARSSWEAGLDLCQRLRDTGLGDTAAFDRVVDLFEPPSAHRGHFALWFAGVVGPSGDRLVKAYMNPQIHGAEEAPGVLRQALERLDMSQAWPHLEPFLSGPGASARVPYFSVDLAPREEGRVKVYLARSGSAHEVDRIASTSASIGEGDATAWLEHLTGSSGPYDGRPILTCLSFRRHEPRPGATVHVPIRCYARDDGQAVDRVTELLNGENASRLRAGAEAVGRRPLSAGAGVLTYASVRREPGGLRVTVYLAPELYAPATAQDESLASTTAG